MRVCTRLCKHNRRDGTRCDFKAQMPRHERSQCRLSQQALPSIGPKTKTHQHLSTCLLLEAAPLRTAWGASSLAPLQLALGTFCDLLCSCLRCRDLRIETLSGPSRFSALLGDAQKHENSSQRRLLAIKDTALMGPHTCLPPMKASMRSFTSGGRLVVSTLLISENPGRCWERRRTHSNQVQSCDFRISRTIAWRSVTVSQLNTLDPRLRFRKLTPRHPRLRSAMLHKATF